MADVSSLILTVLGLSFNLASIFFSYAKDVRSDGLYALIGVL